MSPRRSITLDRWRVRDASPGEGDARCGGQGWIAVTAPGDLYQALVAAGRLEHPFERRNEAAAAWVRDREWWWSTTFAAPSRSADQTVELVFEGLDTFAEIFLDEVSLGRTDNMFRTWRFDLAAHSTPGAVHRLAVRFDPPDAATASRNPLPVWSAFTDRVSRTRRNLMRKAQFGWGWDWAPDLPTVGVWRPARLELTPRARIVDVAFATLAAREDAAEAEIRIELSDAAVAMTVEVLLTGPDGDVAFAYSGPLREALFVRVAHPRLWWTADRGDPTLYGLEVRLVDAGRPIDEMCRRVGLRTVEIDQSPDPDEPGAAFFRFRLNGQPLFAKGACWVPPSAFVADVDPDAYARLVRQAVDANMNMVRVWGGGVYEPDLFYALCDAHGLLVWQDFMFACAHYPEDGEFVASIRAEVEDQVRRLRHHACLAVWCGNNESQAMNWINAELGGEPTPLSGQVLYDEVIPRVLARLAPETPYRPGSPWGGAHPNGMKAGDVHDWTVWHGLPPIPDDAMIGEYAASPEGLHWRRYAEDMARFVSEFGIQAAPSLPALARWLDPADLAPDSPGFVQRIKDEARKAEALMSLETGSPADLQDYVDFTQWIQAEGLTFGIEHFRRRSPQCSGALVWQLNDCWPSVSWSLVDYDGGEKAAYHAVRRAFSPVLASFRELPDDEIELWITNDAADAADGEAVVALESFAGETVWRTGVAWRAPAGGHAVVWRGRTPQTPDQVLIVRSREALFPTNRRFAAPVKALPLPPTEPRVIMRRSSPTRIALEITAPVYLAFVHLVSARADLAFSDNFFDLPAGETRAVVITAESALDLTDVDVRCWNTRKRPGGSS